MYHPLAVHIQQSTGNIFKLSGEISSVTGGVNGGSRPYKLEPIHIPMCLNELLDIPIDHPFRNHREEPFPHCHSQKREHIRMVEGSPCYNFLAEHLHDHNDYQPFDTHFRKALGGDPHS